MPNPLPRSKVKKNQTWNAESVFETPEEFDAEIKNLVGSLAALKKFQGHLGDGPDTFIKVMKKIDALSQRASKVQVYATLSGAVDATDQRAAEMHGKATSALAQVSAATSFVEPEIIGIGEKKVRQWLKNEPRMSLYEHYFDDVFRKGSHVRSAEVEELFGMLRDPFNGTRNTAGMLANADFKFKPARDRRDKKIELTQSSYNAIMHGADRKARRN